ncbi:MAG: class I SAM-dependent methyltransferase family protein [Thermoplasmata archaeon]|nr:class I SAM-dependent methyltransferase family protein [Thermoplasmata archaeon]
MNLAIVVDKREAEKIKNTLIEKNLLDDSRKIIRHENKVEFPIKKRLDGFNIIKQKHVLSRKIFPPFEEIKRRAIGKISMRDFAQLPKKWEKFGDVLVLKMNGIEDKKKVAELYAEVLNCKAVMEDVGGIKGIIRKPSLKFLIGNNAETVHIENGIKYKFDAAAIMFSSGNVDERIRMAGVAKKNDIVVDMFAGIGYFTLPIAVYGKARVYAYEINPIAYKYLEENIKLNNVYDRVKAELGDCRKKIVSDVADRVVMGYLDSLPFLPYAIKSIKGNGIIYMHSKCREEEFPYKLFNKAKEIIKKHGFKAELLYHKKVKSYAPHIIHAVLDIKIE